MSLTIARYPVWLRAAISLAGLLVTCAAGGANPLLPDSQPAADHGVSSGGRPIGNEAGEPEPFQHVLYLDSNPSVSGSLLYQKATGISGSAIVKLDAPGDFRDGEYVEIDHGGGPCTIWSAGQCHTLDDITPAIAVRGAAGRTRYCVQLAVLDNNGGVSRALNPPGGTCIANAPDHLDDANYVAIRYNRATKSGRSTPGDQAYAFWVSTKGTAGPWTKRGVMNLPTQGVTPTVDDKGGSKLVYDEDQIPMLNTTDPAIPDPSAYWWIPGAPPAQDLDDWLLTRVMRGGGAAYLTLADPIVNPNGVRGVRINHDDEPPIQELLAHLAPHTEVVFGAHTYRLFQLMFGNGAKSHAAIAIGIDPPQDSELVVAGAGMDKTVLEMPPCFNAGDGILVAGSGENHVKNVVLRDLAIDNHACGFLPNGPTSAALNTSYADEVAIERVRAVNGATATVWVGAGVNGYYFDQSEASGGWGDVFHADCGAGEPCPRRIWVTHSRFPVGGADGGFGVMSSNPLDASRDVHVDYNQFRCGSGFQGVVGGDFIGNRVIVDNRHVFDAGLFAPDGINNYGNSDLYIAFNKFDKKIAYGYRGTDSYGDPPSAVQLGNIHTGDNRNPTAQHGGRIRFEHNEVTTSEPINIFVCDRLTAIENNSISDVGVGSNHHGLHLACKHGVTDNTSNLMGGNRYQGQRVAIYAGNRENPPRFTSWGKDVVAGATKLIDDASMVPLAAGKSESKAETGVSERDGVQRREVPIQAIAPAGTRDVRVAWAKPFADEDYAAVCSVLTKPQAAWSPRARVTSHGAAELTVHVINDDARAAHGGLLTCQALHH